MYLEKEMSVERYLASQVEGQWRMFVTMGESCVQEKVNFAGM